MTGLEHGHATCPLCFTVGATHHLQHQARDFYHCSHCDLIFVPSTFHLRPAEELALYNQHQNDAQDPGYRQFLNTLIEPLTRYLTPGMQGLDFGSGPGPTMHLMLQERGYPTNHFDPFYANVSERLTSQYDFVTCSETVEHFCQPQRSWRQLFTLLNPDGMLGVMTLRHDLCEAFSSWWYKNDKTHVAFYSSRTFAYIAEHFGVTLCEVGDRIAIFKHGRATL